MAKGNGRELPPMGNDFENYAPENYGQALKQQAAEMARGDRLIEPVQ